LMFINNRSPKRKRIVDLRVPPRRPCGRHGSDHGRR
jgi:hypothetical protein